MRSSFLAALLALFAVTDACYAQARCAGTSSLGIGTATQGGYTFEYESVKGASCLTYRVRNTPRKLLTPVSWRADKETLIETTLGECTNPGSCSWFSSSLITTAPSGPAPTKLSFGINRDEYTTTPEALLPKHSDPKSASLQSLTTILEGVIAESEKVRTRVGVSVLSEVKELGPEKGFILVYLLRLVDDSTPMRVLASAAENGPNELAVVWEAAGIAFANQLRQRNLGVQSIKDSPVQIEVNAPSLRLESSKTLAIYRGTTRIASTSAPAYIRPE